MKKAEKVGERTSRVSVSGVGWRCYSGNESRKEIMNGMKKLPQQRRHLRKKNLYLNRGEGGKEWKRRGERKNQNECITQGREMENTGRQARGKVRTIINGCRHKIFIVSGNSTGLGGKGKNGSNKR